MMSTSVCVSVCPRGYAISYGTTRAIVTNYFFLCMLPMGVAGSSSGRVTKSQEEWAVLGVSSTLTMHCNAFAAKGISREGAMGVHSAGEVCCCYRFRSFRCHFGCLKTVERRTYTAATHVRCRQLLHNYES